MRNHTKVDAFERALEARTDDPEVGSLLRIVEALEEMKPPPVKVRRLKLARWTRNHSIRA